MTNGHARGGSVVNLRRVGSIDLRDLYAISRYHGREFMPYPFVVRDPARFNLYVPRADDAGPAPDRFNHGDLRIFRQWFTTYQAADIRVECNVEFLGLDTPSLRILAHRSGDFGFFATQDRDHAVDVFTLPAYELGAAIAGSVPLTKPGKHSKIVIPEYIPRPAQSADRGSAPAAFSVPIVTTATTTKVPESAVTVYATVQSQWRPAREWGFDRTKHAVVWVRIKDDGEYIYAPDYTHAKPMTARSLRDGIDRLVSADVLLLRAFRRG